MSVPQIPTPSEAAPSESFMLRPAPRTLRTVERNRAPWTADDLDRLCDLMARRRPIREIADTLGRTQEAVRTKAYQLDRLTGPSL